MGCFMSMYPGTSKYGTQKYNIVEENLRTGDILLFSAKQLTSWGIRISTNSPWSHVGMIVRSSEFSSNGKEKLYIWHSVQQKISFTHDVVTKTKKQGPQLNDLRTMIEHSLGTVYIRRLRNVPSEIAIGDPADNEDLKAYFMDTAKKDYEKDFGELMRSQLDAPLIGNNTEDMSSVFCSELMADTYRKFNYMAKPEIPSNEFVPSDFSSGRTFHIFKYARSYFKLNNRMNWGIEDELVI